MNLSLSSKNMPEMNSISIKSDVDNLSIKDNESVEKKKKLSQVTIKSKNIENSPEFFEETKKDLSKSPNSSEKEKNFPNAITNLFSRKYEDYSKKIGLVKRIFFKIVQLKILYNKIRSVINIIKIFISLELILKDEETNNKSLLKNNKLELNTNNNISNNNIDKNNKTKYNENNNLNIINNESKEETFLDIIKTDSAPTNKYKNGIKINIEFSDINKTNSLKLNYNKYNTYNTNSTINFFEIVCSACLHFSSC